MIHVELSAWSDKYLRKQSKKYFRVITQQETFFLQVQEQTWLFVEENFSSKDVKCKRQELFFNFNKNSLSFKFIRLKEKVIF